MVRILITVPQRRKYIGSASCLLATFRGLLHELVIGGDGRA